MAFDRIKFWFLLFCATVLVGVSAYAKPDKNAETSVRAGIFNSQETAQNFFEALPLRFQKTIDPKQLWLNAYKSLSGLTEYYLDISALRTDQAERLCIYLQEHDTQCVISERRLLLNSASVTALPDARPLALQPLPPSAINGLPRMLQPLGMRLKDTPYHHEQGFNLAFSHHKPTGTFSYQKNIEAYSDNFTLAPHTNDTLEAQAAKAAYDVARRQFIETIRSVGEGINAGTVDDAARENLMALGKELFETAGSVYLAGFLEQEFGQAEILSSEAGSGETFIHHVKKNMSESARSTVERLIAEVMSGATTDEGLQEDFIKTTTDTIMLSGAQGLINAGLTAAKRSDLYALRHLELEYNLNNFKDSYLSVLVTQPMYQSVDLRHNIFLQGSSIINEKSVDINDDTSRHTINLGGAYRYLTTDEKYLLGANLFFDHQWPYNHSRMSIGLDAKAQDFNFATNYYYPLSDFRDSRTDANGLKYEERALEGYDVELGYTFPFLPEVSVFGKGYQYFRETEDDLRGLELSAEYNIRNNFTIKGSVIEENGGRNGAEIALQYRVPLYDENKPNLALAALNPTTGNSSVRSKIFEKVRRENRIRVEERLKVNANLTVITAQFNALSAGLPFDVGGALTGAGVTLPFNTAITVPNGDFGIITFSNGAIANISASGAGDVILEFNNSTLTVTATNGGFVQFISGSGGGITVVNVPGGTVNLLGTDIDVTDDGATTTIQVRAGQIEVVPNVGVAILGGNQAEVVSLTIATGATSLLVNPALKMRQDASYTNLDLINPSPPTTESSAPFINVTPALITGPQFVGNNADLRFTFTQPVTISGAPFINGLIDANARTFAYNAGASTPTQLVFRHVYIAGDVGSAAITIQTLDLNGGTIIGTANTLNAITAFTNTVAAITDQTAPMLTSSTPADNAPAFNGGANIILNFDENVVANIGNITLTDTTDGSDTHIIPIGDAQVVIAGSTVTINPTGVLDLSTDYDLVIGNDVIRDTAGNAFTGIASGALNFTTSNDVTPPMLTGTVPNDNATSVARTANIVLTFDDNAVIGSGNITIHRTANNTILETIAVGSANVTGGGTTTITINPTTDLPAATEVYVLIPSTAFEDINGNDFAGINATTDLSFRTFSPLDLSNITLWLDGEDIDGDNIPEGVAEGGLVAGDISVWTDKSGNNNDTTQTTPGERPSFANPGADFVGTTNSVAIGDFMRITNGGASGLTVIAVLEGVAQNVSGTVNAFLDSTGTDYTFLRVAAVDYKISLDGSINRQGVVALDGNAFVGPGGNLAAPGPFPTDALLYIQYTTAPTDHEIIGGLTTGGGLPVNPQFRGKFVLREMIMYSDAKTSGLAGIDEREQIEGYLAHKYGITGRLPVAHPFKTVAP